MPRANFGKVEMAEDVESDCRCPGLFSFRFAVGQNQNQNADEQANEKLLPGSRRSQVKHKKPKPGGPPTHNSSQIWVLGSRAAVPELNFCVDVVFSQRVQNPNGGAGAAAYGKSDRAASMPLSLPLSPYFPSAMLRKLLAKVAECVRHGKLYKYMRYICENIYIFGGEYRVYVGEEVWQKLSE